jgi:hypothetical protein
MPGASAFSSSECLLDWGLTGASQSRSTGAEPGGGGGAAAAAFTPLSWEECAAARRPDNAGDARAPANSTEGLMGDARA